MEVGTPEVQIDEQDFFVPSCQFDAEVGGDKTFTNAPFSAADADYLFLRSCHRCNLSLHANRKGLEISGLISGRCFLHLVIPSNGIAAY